MRLQLVLQVRQAQIMLPVFLETCLPKSAAWIEDNDLEKLLQVKPYHEAVDSALCHALPQFRTPCLRFYRGRGPRLSETPGVTPEILEVLDNAVLDWLKGVNVH